jgi:hypothetical protein
MPQQSGKFKKGVGKMIERICDSRFQEAEALYGNSKVVIIRSQV